MMKESRKYNRGVNENALYTQKEEKFIGFIWIFTCYLTSTEPLTSPWKKKYRKN